jgi:hypothetical protein
MCDACISRLSRRKLLRQIGLGGAAALTASWATDTPTASALLYGDDDGASGEDPAAPARAGAAVPAGIVLSRTIADVNRTGPPAPPIVSRREWGADESIRAPQRAFAPVRKLVVHHTASINGPRDPADVVRTIHRFHTVTRGFTDIGYNYLIDHRGTIYEGRYARRFGDEPISAEDRRGWGVVGAHSKAMNAGTCGVCMIGEFSSRLPTEAALASLSALLAWKASRHRIDVLDEDAFVNSVGSYDRFPNLAGHRHVGSTVCPGATLARFLPTLRQQVAAAAGRWEPLVADVPRLLRYEWSPYGQGPLTDPYGKAGATSAPPPPSAPAPAVDAAPASGAASAGTGATTVTGVRALSSSGLVFTAGRAAKHGQPGGADGALVAMSTPGWGDGYATLSSSGVVRTYGSLPVLGDVSDKGGAADIACTPSGNGYWILMTNGGIYPFGDARYFGSPLKNGSSVGGVRIARRPQGDGYWVLGGDGVVRGFGAAATLDSPQAGGAKPVGLAATATGAGYWVLLEDGTVAAFGDATASGGPATSGRRWTAPAVAIAAVAGSAGYVVSAKDGGLSSFGGAPFLGSFAGSGATVVSVVTAAA